MLRWWGDLSVSKKLYAVVGVMALLIASELFTLLFAMEVLSAVRSFVGGEGLWSKGQKDAVHALHRYAFTGDNKFYDEFHKQLEISHGDRAARLELEKPTYDLGIVTQGFQQGKVDPADVPGLVKLIRRFYWVHYIAEALRVWREADQGIFELERAGEKLHSIYISTNGDREAVDGALAEIDALNERLTALEIRFSEILGAGSRWLEHILMLVLIMAVLTVESTGLFLTITFSRNLSSSLRELTETSKKIGAGNFEVKLPVRSHDELGQLAEAINKMSSDLKNSTWRQMRAESASEVKSRFLANMSHEIRTPLGVILGLTEILKDPLLDWQDQLRYIETIERTGKNLTRIINDILDLSKVEAGYLEIERTNFNLSEFMGELYTMLIVQAKKTGNELKFTSQGELPAEIYCDRTRLRQIIVNLVNNALKFTSNGQVHLFYYVQNKDLVFDVIDNGSGIESKDREKLFDAFTRTESAVGTRAEGTGLGLLLSRQLARALGGDVTLVSTELGKGSQFRVGVPLVEVASFKPPKTEAVDSVTDVLSGKKVLVVEDSKDNQMLVKLILDRQGMRVDFANNGSEGYKRAIAGQYDLVLMDMQMPVMDGYQATNELRSNGYTKPIIALTAHAMKEDRERCLQAGCSDYLTKPIDSNVLYGTLARHLDAVQA
jgi:signal transduction histidine kinase/CheY-like chemotaxis protein